MPIVDNSNFFEERAEHLSREELENWTVTSARDAQIISKLTGSGAKLLSGPRGCGKSTYLKRAYYSLIDQKGLPVYVNYSTSMRLEPLFTTRANAVAIFRQWLLYKILRGLRQTFEDLKISPSENLNKWITIAEESIDALQKGVFKSDLSISIEQLKTLIKDELNKLSITRCVLLLDDAAHVFSEDQQREFFEVFRELKCREVSPKAAIYPGVTSFSRGFHIGHEAAPIEAWYDPDDDDYLQLMRELVQNRFPEEIKYLLNENKEIINLLAYASFGVPRGFINLVGEITQSVSSSSIKINKVKKSIKDHADIVTRVYTSLIEKLPRFKNYITTGTLLINEFIDILSDYNKHNKKGVIVAINEPASEKFKRVMQFLEYSGMVRRIESLSKGEKGNFNRYIIHYALLISGNAFSLGSNYKIDNLNRILASIERHSFVRRKETALLNGEINLRCTLELPPCRKCHSVRISEHQRFCVTCGSELTNTSIYKELMSASVELLPLPSKKIEGILSTTNLKTVEDIISDETSSLQKVPGIGHYWQARIKTIAIEFVGV